MATFNTETTMLKDAVNSILDQTFKDFEFIIIDDGSDNESVSYLKSISDSRVRIITNPHNMGITKSLNIGLQHAQGKYLARMDADDVSAPTRLEKEYCYMEKHPDVVVCGSRTADFDDKSIVCGFEGKQRSLKMEEYRVRLLFKNPGPIHPTSMIRREVLITNNVFYDERLIYAQDYGMWEVLSHYGRIHTLKDILLYRRKHDNQISVAKRETQINCDKMTQKKILAELLGSVSDEEVDFHYIHSSGYFPQTVITPEVIAWYNRLIEANKERHIFNRKYLKEGITHIEMMLAFRSFGPNMSFFNKIINMFRYIPLFPGIKIVIRHKINSFILKNLNKRR
jgi:glycosyltransferase involved in cell wall biosynthesis